LGLDSFVLVDDNPVECGLVRKLLPQVTVLQVPEKLYRLPFLALEQGLFDTIRLTDEDRKRALLYQGESQRKTERGAFANVEDYLSSLKTVACIHRARWAEIPRVAQLTQKTNQFNLTTKRYSERDVQAFAERQDAAVFTLSVHDRFGDLGLVSVLILERSGAVGRIDSFLMSCRVLGRGLECAILTHCLDIMGSTWNIDTWQAEYIPTRKNMQVADFWSMNGFVQAGEEEGRRTYVRDARASGTEIPSYVCVRED
jgi:FkbH-like protein